MELSTGNAPFAHVQLVLAHPRHPCWLRKPRLVTQFNLVRASTGNALGQSRVDRLCRPSLSTVSVSFEAANESFRLLVLNIFQAPVRPTLDRPRQLEHPGKVVACWRFSRHVEGADRAGGLGVQVAA